MTNGATMSDISDWLDAIEARAEAATPGNWAHTSTDPTACHIETDSVASDGFTQVAENMTCEDAHFLTHARTDVPALVKELRRCRKTLEFYANTRNYLDGVPGEWTGPMAFDDPSSDFDYDMGERARAALNGGPDD